MFLVLETCIALEAANGGDAHLGHQIRILAKRFFDPPPTRISRDIHHWRERLVCAASARFFRGHRVKRLHERRIESRSQPDGMAKTCAVLCRVSVKAFLVKDNRYSE